MHVEQRVDEQPAPEIGGVAAELAAFIVEGAVQRIVVEIGVNEAAKGPEHQDIVVAQQSPPAEIDAALEVDGLKVPVEVVFVAAAVGGDALAVLVQRGNRAPNL